MALTWLPRAVDMETLMCSPSRQIKRPSRMDTHSLWGQLPNWGLGTTLITTTLLPSVVPRPVAAPLRTAPPYRALRPHLGGVRELRAAQSSLSATRTQANSARR